MTKWNEQRIETMKTLWADGHSCSEISRTLNCGISRSAVIGKVHRLGLARRDGVATRTKPPPSQSYGENQKHRTFRPRDRLVDVTPLAQEIELRTDGHPEPVRLANGELIGTFDLTSRHCRYPHGTPGQIGFHYCGQPPKAGASWCPTHAARMWQPKKAESADTSVL